MELTIVTKELREAFAQAATLAPGRTTKPVLMNVLLSCRLGWLELTGTNTEQGIRVGVKCEGVRLPGSCLINATKGQSLLRELTGETVTIREDNGIVEIQSGSTKARLQSVSADEFPSFGEAPEEGLQLRSLDFSEAIGRTAMSCDTESTRYALGGICLQQDGRALKLVSTDTRRMSVAHITAENDFQFGDKLLIPSAFLSSVRKILVDSDPLVTISKVGENVMLSSGNTELFSRTVQGVFPKWKGVIPTPEYHVPISASALVSAIRQVSVTTNEESKALKFDFSAESLVISSQAADVGASSTALPLQGGPDVSINMDGRLLTDWLKCFEPSTLVDFGLTDGNTQILLTFGEQKYVVMPIAKGG